MWIGPVRREGTPGGVRVAADVAFEDARRTPIDLGFEVDAGLAGSLPGTTDPFLLAAAPAAAWAGERRVLVEGPACGVLRRNLEGILRVYRDWFPGTSVPVLEATGGFVVAPHRATTRTAAFVSGGVDALALLRENRLDVPLGHPSSIVEGVHVFGLHEDDFHEGPPGPDRREAERGLEEWLRRLGEMASFELSVVRTDASLLYEDLVGWSATGWAAATVAAGLAIGSRFSDLSLGSDGHAANPTPHASHPMLDDRFSSAAVRVRSGQPFLTRLEKVGLLAGWEASWPFLRPCRRLERSPAGPGNCGRCEKCVRTMLELLAWGVLDRVEAFPERDVRPEHVHGLRSVRGRPIGYYGEPLRTALLARGRSDLVRALDARVVPAREGPFARFARHLRRGSGGGGRRG